jgi:predicted RNase H-like nuclease (RuvC/YqgF family)
MRQIGIVYTPVPTVATPKETTSMDTPERIAKLEAQVENIKESVSELKDDVKEIHSRITTGNREIVDKLESMDSRIEQRMKENAEISQQQHAEIQASARADIDKIAQRVDVLERWRYMIVGGAIALGYLVSHLEVFGKLFK